MCVRSLISSAWYYQHIPFVRVGEVADMLKSARLIASGNEALSNILPEQLFSWSVVAVDRMEQIR
jgi:hypothetical protein